MTTSSTVAAPKSKAFFPGPPPTRADFLGGTEAALDETDSLRVTLQGGTVVHLRPSGNAPEFRCYAEATDRNAAQTLVRETLAKVAARLG